MAHIDWQLEAGSHPVGAKANVLFPFWMAGFTVQSGPFDPVTANGTLGLTAMQLVVEAICC